MTLEQALIAGITGLTAALVWVAKRLLLGLEKRLRRAEMRNDKCEEDRHQIYLVLADMRKEPIEQVEHTARILKERWEDESDTADDALEELPKLSFRKR